MPPLGNDQQATYSPDAATFIAWSFSPSGPPRAVSERLQARVRAGELTWAQALAAQMRAAREAHGWRG